MSRLILRRAMVLVMALTLRGQDLDTETLKGIRALSVLVENLSGEAEDAGLHRSDIQTDVELKLRLAGIKVLTKEESLKELGSPYLYINAHVMMPHQSPGLAALALSISLEQDVVLVRERSIMTHAATWQIEFDGTVATSNIRTVRDGIKDIVDKFLNAYLSVNPKK